MGCNCKESKRGKTKLSRGIWACLGAVSFALGVLGAFLPILPSTPFIMFAAYCAARASKRFEQWFTNTALYKQVFESLVQTRQMTMQSKVKLLVSVSLLFSIGLYFMWHIVAMRFVLGVIWLGHVLYFGFKIPTIKE